MKNPPNHQRCTQNCTLYTQRTNGARSCSHQYGTCGLKTYEIKARPFRNCFFHFRKTNDKRIWQARLLADAPNALNLQTSRKGHGHFPRFPENAEKLMIFPGVCCTCALQPWEQNCAVISLMVSRCKMTSDGNQLCLSSEVRKPGQHTKVAERRGT